jgi:hypothetical protein
MLPHATKPSPAVLSNLYLTKKQSACTIAEQFGVSDATIFRWLTKYGIRTRSVKDKSYCKKLTASKDELRKDYIDDGMSLEKMSNKYGVSIAVLLRRFSKDDIKTRRAGPQSGEKNFRWKGGVIRNRGYRWIYSKGHPYAPKIGYLPEQVLVMEKVLGRYLEKQERVHHKNGVKSDNRPENLTVFPTDRLHQLHEAKLQMFAKQLLFGDLEIPYRLELLKLFDSFEQIA